MLKPTMVQFLLWSSARPSQAADGERFARARVRTSSHRPFPAPNP